MYCQVMMWLYTSFGLMVGFTGLDTAGFTIHYYTRTQLSTITSSLAVARLRLPTADVSFPLNYGITPASATSYSRLTHVKVKVKFALQLVVYRQTVSLGVKALETHDQRFFPQMNPCGNSPSVTSSLTRSWVCLL
jgi:hypothetical protein